MLFNIKIVGVTMTVENKSVDKEGYTHVAYRRSYTCSNGAVVIARLAKVWSPNGNLSVLQTVKPDLNACSSMSYYDVWKALSAVELMLKLRYKLDI